MSTVKVRTALTRNYGAYTAHVEIESEVEAGNGTDILAERDKHWKLLRLEIIEFETHHLRGLQGKKAVDQATKSIDQDVKGDDGTKGQWVKALGIVCEHKKGQDYFYIKTAKGTKWSTHGVSFYWDNFEGMTKLEYDKRKDASGEVVFPEDMYVAIISRAGKPDRGVALSHKDNIEVEA
jgi:hypothetical protein